MTDILSTTKKVSAIAQNLRGITALLATNMDQDFQKISQAVGYDRALAIVETAKTCQFLSDEILDNIDLLELSQPELIPQN